MIGCHFFLSKDNDGKLWLTNFRPKYNHVKNDFLYVLDDLTSCKKEIVDYEAHENFYVKLNCGECIDLSTWKYHKLFEMECEKL